MGIRVSQIPEQFQNEFFAEIVKARGVEDSKELIRRDIDLMCAFQFSNTEKGHQYWEAISQGLCPCKGKSDRLKALIKEAKQRGYKVGVMTEFGLIVKGFKHELLSSSGDFFFSNVKVYSSERGWAKINNDNDEDLARSSAIHSMIEQILKGLRSN